MFRSIPRATALTGALLLGAAPASSASLTVQLDAIPSGQGKIYVEAFADSEGWRTRQSVAAAVRPAAEGVRQVTLNGLEAGESYAVWAYHDTDGNRQLARDDLGLPQEPWALSTDFQPQSSSWDFKDFSFALGGESATRTLTVRQ